MVWDIRGEILRASQQVGAAILELQSEAAEGIRTEVIKRFTDDYIPQSLIWNHLRDYSFVICNDPHSWLVVSNFIKNTKVLVLFNDVDDKTVFEFTDGADIVPTLQECFGFEYYLTNYELDYLICFNHHDVLIAAGTACSWLTELTNDKGELIEPFSSDIVK